MSKDVKTGSVTPGKKDYRHEALSKASTGKLAVTQETSQGCYVISQETIAEGEVLLECPAASIALDPAYRHSHCGNCARPIDDGTMPCPECFVVTTCASCRAAKASQWHTDSGECRVLRCLVDAFCRVFGEFQGINVREAALRVESIYIITMRLVHRRHATKVACPLPAIDWKLVALLYSSPLPAGGSSEATGLTTAMATLLQIMNDQLKEHKQPPLRPPECLDIWNKCRGCCHNITDLSRPLGEQSLGMALFVPHSFYNHGCVPSAFLSCMLPPPPPAATTSSLCAVTARVVCCRETLRKGEPIVLSYIPLSGLCRRERQMRLQKSYHFVCGCEACSTDSDRLEQAVGGEFATSDDQVQQILGPLRELQIECHQNLRAAAAASETTNTGGTEDIVEHCIAMLHMAQRGIRNNQIPLSHEVALECHRLLAVAHSLLHDVDQELSHHEEFLKAAGHAMGLMDPSALALQHRLAVQCLQKKVDNSQGGQLGLKEKRNFHFNEAIRIAKTALGEDHPYVCSVQLPLAVASAQVGPSESDSNKRRKLDQ